MQRPPRRFAALCVSALVLVACTSGGLGPSSSVPTPTAAPAAIDELRAAQPTSWAPSGRGWGVTLSWIASPGVSSFQVRRDGVLLADALTAPVYQDAGADPGTTYRYAVVGSDAQGAPTDPAVVTITTGAPANTDARLQGSFLVHMRMESTSGLRSDPSSGDLLFRYAPVCAGGPCDVHWSVRAHHPSGPLDRTGGRYRGRVRGPFLIRSCGGGVIDEQISMTTQVTSAGPVHHTWRATRVEGTLVESGTAPGCARASITWTFAGVIQT